MIGLRATVLAVALTLGSGCFTTGYLLQAGRGEAEMLASARPILVALRDPTTPPHVKRLLFHLEQIKAFGQAQGLQPTRNYERYADLGREAAVWVVEACPPLSFESHRWTFPIVGSVPYLGFFAPERARRYADALAAQEGLDVEVREASAYSTLGWFRDPVLSTMLSDDAAADGDLADTVLHESVHATVYVANQSAFDESLASYVADRLTPVWLTRPGADRAEAKAWEAQEERYRKRVDRLHQLHDELAALYASRASDSEKRARKKEMLERVQHELGLRHPLNNASLAGYATYDTGGEAFDALFQACGRSWPRFLAAAGTLREGDFAQAQQEELSGVVQRLIGRGCPAAPR